MVVQMSKSKSLAEQWLEGIYSPKEPLEFTMAQTQPKVCQSPVDKYTSGIEVVRDKLMLDKKYIDVLNTKLDKEVFDLTYNEYCQRFSRADYEDEIYETRLRLALLLEIVKDMGAMDQIEHIRYGYLNVKVDLTK